MIRIQISLEKQEYDLARRAANKLHISFAEFVRRCISQSLAAAKIAPWMRYAGFVETGNPHSSNSIDESVYGTKDSLPFAVSSIKIF
jgi:hypothetical protein